MNETNFTNTLYTNDNLFILTGLNSNLVDLIYLDPPFNSKRTYSAPIGSKSAGASFKDMWTWDDVNEAYLETLAEDFPALPDFIGAVGVLHSKAMSAYLTYMAQRIIEMHRVLKDTGSLYLHCDPTASHYLKIVLDEIFGKNNFRNEINWCYASGGVSKRYFARKHDIILFYAKSKNYKFNTQYREYSEGTKQRGLTAYKKRLNENYELSSKGAVMSDWWADIIPLLSPTSYERTGYPTQKPLALLQRIIKASSNEDDLVLDPFCGCATTMVAAQQLGRKWIGIDIEWKAKEVLIQRLSDDSGMFKDFISPDFIPQRTDVIIVAPTKKEMREQLYKEQNKLCNGCGHEYFLKDLETDHIVPKAKGGGDYYENYQLLCGNCNKMKGKNTMEYLRMKNNTHKKILKKEIIFGE